MLSRLAVLAVAPAQREARAQCLVLLGHLLKLLTRWGAVLKCKEGEGVAELAGKLQMAPSVLEGLLDLFYSRESGAEVLKWSLPKEKRDLMLGWALVLAVRAEAQSTLEVEPFRALVEELKMRPADVVARLRELGCACLPVSSAGEGAKRGSAYRVSLMPPTDEPTPFGQRFPRLKLGGRKPGGR